MRFYIDKRALQFYTKGMNKETIAQKCGVRYETILRIVSGSTETITKEMALKLQDCIHKDYLLFTKGVVVGYQKPKKDRKPCLLECDREMITRVARVKGDNPNVIADIIISNKSIRKQTTFTKKEEILQHIEYFGIGR